MLKGGEIVRTTVVLTREHIERLKPLRAENVRAGGGGSVSEAVRIIVDKATRPQGGK